ncbi:3-methyl-2-oxobutanoate hydroxymethyltransferase [Virgibacillus dokdonensis]|uniref:3-methyl-2-oxobutanoate hydroxymethyltransferase n=1 Tax=Virgibacillus dokdonensis TaxID=302167 RepID=A0A2K9IVZ1_9BACI|nr:3-methyl-2-oxobutanoate hydroxymethyltransferase [Virgibacillus dokdonensis]AUJ23564.1 3-methyl-2-oxobutanoate hydroxymethyltransferase [Virgibacillus dokdonensis]
MKSTIEFLKMKQVGEKITMVTAYDYPQAKLAEKAGIDMILVGDSLGMVVLGYDSTVPVTTSDMIHHTKAVKRGAQDTFIVTDLPFMSYHISKEEALRTAGKMMQEGGTHAVKLEGGGEVIDIIQALKKAGVPVMGHLGLTPQSAGVLGGYKVQAKTAEQATELMKDAKQCEAAGAFALVLECIPHQLAQKVTSQLRIPVIGIGAGSKTDGQVLVFHDVVTFGVDRVPKFVKSFADVNREVLHGLNDYVREVKAGHFPKGSKHTFSMEQEELTSLKRGEIT